MGTNPLNHFLILAGIFGLDKAEPVPNHELCLLTRTFVLPEQTDTLVQSCAPVVSVEDVRAMEEVENY